MPCAGPLCTPGTPPLERAQACVNWCQLWHPDYFRSTLLAQHYRDCLDACGTEQATQGLEAPNWPAELGAQLGQDLSELEQRARLPLALVAVIVVGVAVIVAKLT